MNCRRIEQLLPLYVEGDLKFSVTAQIASHLESCSRCNWMADEFKESQSWLRSHEAPAFDEAFVGDLKRSVLEQVAEPGARASLFLSWIQQWNRRQALALAATFLLVVGAFALYFYQSQRKFNSNVVSKASSPEDTTQTQTKHTPDTEAAPGASLAPRRLSMKGRHSFRAQTSSTVARQPLQARRPRTDQEIVSQANSIEQIDSSTDVLPDSHDMLRIEIQTSDPNIRIIWFAPKEVDHQPTKPLTTAQQ